MGEYLIKKSETGDLERIDELYDKARAIMRGDGNLTQWAAGYPNKDSAMADIIRGNSYVMLEGEGKGGKFGEVSGGKAAKGEICGTFAFIKGEEPTYRKIYGGKWLNGDLPYATIHRLASTPESRGIAYSCFDWCFRQLPNLRIDTHRDNSIMRHVIEKWGFEYRGVILLANGEERLAYQKIAGEWLVNAGVSEG